mmetsp:Transcript_7604/g.28513  ORF Transcript_7604/g.28513 Transcript_7604/m.28513 type:complete len:90 (-) Transcript_7604:113-382(-)
MDNPKIGITADILTVDHILFLLSRRIKLQEMHIYGKEEEIVEQLGKVFLLRKENRMKSMTCMTRKRNSWTTSLKLKTSWMGINKRKRKR